MYTVSDIVAMGEAHELILTEVKVTFLEDDFAEQTMDPLEYFEE